MTDFAFGLIGIPILLLVVLVIVFAISNVAMMAVFVGFAYAVWKDLW